MLLSNIGGKSVLDICSKIYNRFGIQYFYGNIYLHHNINGVNLICLRKK